MTPGTLIPTRPTEQTLHQTAVDRGMRESRLNRKQSSEGVDRIVRLAAQGVHNADGRALIAPEDQDATYALFLDVIMPHGVSAKSGSAHAALEELVSHRLGTPVRIMHEENADGCGLTAIKVDELAA